MDSALKSRLEQVYAEHPLNAASILDRVLLERGTLLGVRAQDLAESATGGPTDQNHSGGAAATRALAAAVDLESSWTVLDVGTGLGGTPRMLAEEYGCSCHGIELTRTRFRDAMELTRLVGLADRVTFTQGDILTVEVPSGPFDLVIAQGSLMHFSDLPAVLIRIATLLRPNGKLAVEEGVILRKAADGAERNALDTLLHLWNGHFQLFDEWPRFLDRAGFRYLRSDDLTDVAMRDFADLLAAADTGRLCGVTPDERRGWELGYQLLCSRQLGFARVQAIRSPV